MTTYSMPMSRWFYQGAPASNGNIRVYQTGTTSIVTIYADAALTTPVDNPFVLDSNGEAHFYVGSSTALRFDVYTNGGTLIESLDPVYPVLTSSNLGNIATENMGKYLHDDGVGNVTLKVGGGIGDVGDGNLSLLAPSFRNALINGDIVVSQRNTSWTGISGFSTPQQTSDGWFAWAGGTASMSVSQQTGTGQFNKVLRAQRANSDTHTVSLFVGQIIRTLDCTRFAGQTVTLSFYARSGAAFSAASGLIGVRCQQGTGADEGSSSYTNGTWTGATLALNTTQAITSTLTRYSFSFSINSTATEIACDFSFTPVGTAGSTDYFEITGIQLEAGGMTGYEFVPFDTQKQRCLPYYRKSFPYAVVPAQNGGVTGSLYVPLSTGQSGIFGASYDFNPPMFKTPSITTFNTSAANANWWDASNSASRTVSIANTSADRTQISGTSGVAASVNVIHYTAEAAI